MFMVFDWKLFLWTMYFNLVELTFFILHLIQKPPLPFSWNEQMRKNEFLAAYGSNKIRMFEIYDEITKICEYKKGEIQLEFDR